MPLVEPVFRSAGVGFPEIYHIGLRYHWEQKQLGLYYGIAEDAQSIGIGVGFGVRFFVRL